MNSPQLELAETLGVSCSKLARAAGVSVGTAHKWKKEHMQIVELA